MPVPKPLAKKASAAKKKTRVAEVLHDLKAGPHHKERTRKQEVAISLKSAGQAKSPARKAADLAADTLRQRKAANRTSRNKGRR